MSEFCTINQEAISKTAVPLGWEDNGFLRQLHVIAGSETFVGREKVIALENRMIELQESGVMQKASLLCTHYFPEGLYARELFVPAGVVLTGKTHKTDHMIQLVKGDMTVWTEEGMKRVQAPFVMISKAGAKRAGVAHSDCIWIGTFPNPNNEKDPFKMETNLVEEAFTIAGGDQLCLA